MNTMHRKLSAVLWLLFSGVVAAQTAPLTAQGGQARGAPGGRGGFRPGPAVVSPQIEADGRVTFRILAPNATSVTVGGDISGSLVPDPGAETAARAVTPAGAQPQAGLPNRPAAVVMTKGENGIWSGTTVRAVKPGAWRYTFNQDPDLQQGVQTLLVGLGRDRYCPSQRASSDREIQVTGGADRDARIAGRT